MPGEAAKKLEAMQKIQGEFLEVTKTNRKAVHDRHKEPLQECADADDIAAHLEAVMAIALR